jgi:ATP-dependent helicase/nuclease subunit A
MVDGVPRPVDAASAQRGLFDEEIAAPAEGAAGSERDVLVVAARGRARPGGPRFGELVHAMLAAAPLDADRAVIEALADVHGRILSAPDEEVGAAVETVQQVIAHELLARARVAEARGRCRRETPVTLTLADGMLVEGVVDLAFEDDGAWIVVDYKTDREIAAGGEEQYRRQVALYASAVAQATGAPCKGVLLVI